MLKLKWTNNFTILYLLQKQDIGLVDDIKIIGFIRTGVVKLWGERSKRELQNEKSLQIVGFEPQPSVYEAEAITIPPWIWFSYIQLRVNYVHISLNVYRDTLDWSSRVYFVVHSFVLTIRKHLMVNP